MAHRQSQIPDRQPRREPRGRVEFGILFGRRRGDPGQRFAQQWSVGEPPVAARDADRIAGLRGKPRECERGRPAERWPESLDAPLVGGEGGEDRRVARVGRDERMPSVDAEHHQERPSARAADEAREPPRSAKIDQRGRDVAVGRGQAAAERLTALARAAGRLRQQCGVAIDERPCGPLREEGRQPAVESAGAGTQIGDPRARSQRARETARECRVARGRVGRCPKRQPVGGKAAHRAKPSTARQSRPA